MRRLNWVVVHARPHRTYLCVHVRTVAVRAPPAVSSRARRSRRAALCEMPRGPTHLPQALDQRVRAELRVVPRVTGIRSDRFALGRKRSGETTRISGVVDDDRNAFPALVIVVRNRADI